MRCVVDHLAGARRGERQVLTAEGRVGFGRHPECTVAFDPERDLDASSRHAELRPTDTGGWVLLDLGSSNGTFVDGLRVSEVAIVPDTPVTAQFGPAGPRLRLLVTELSRAEALPRLVLAPPPRPRWIPLAIGLVLVAAVVAALVVRTLR